MNKTEIKAQKMALLPCKNLAISLLFSLIFGPLGLLYASTLGGVLMTALALIVLGSRLPGPIIFMWVACSVWSVLATQRYNNKIVEAKIKNQYRELSDSGSHG